MTKTVRSNSMGWTRKAKPARGPWRKRFWRSLQDKTAIPERGLSVFGNRKAVLGLSLIIILVGVFAIDQSLKKPGQPSPILRQDPLTAIIYGDNLASGNLNNFNTFLATYNNVGPGINALPNSTHASVALTKNSYDFSLVANKHLFTDQTFRLSSYPTSGTQWGFYLTRNGTLPQGRNYNPQFDPSVSFFLIFDTTGLSTPTIGEYLFFQRDISNSISSEGSNNSCGTTAGVCFTSFLFSAVIGGGFSNFSTMALNYTGSQANGGNNGASQITMTAQAITTSNIFNLPWFQISAQPYFIGFWQSITSNGGSLVFDFAGSQCTKADSTFSCNEDFRIVTPTAQAPPPAPAPGLDTGGFFGPIIKALVSIGVFMLGAILSFLGYIYNLLVKALDTMGNFLGVGAIGTNIANALAGFATWVTNIFVNGFTTLVNALTFIVNSFSSLFTLLGTYWTELVLFTTQLANWATFIWTVLSQILQYTVFGGSLGFIVFWVWGMMSFYSDFDKGIRWATFTERFVIGIGYRTYKWLDDAIIEKVILRFKRLIHPLAA